MNTFSTISSNISSADFWEWDIEKDIRYLSSSFKGALGYTKDELPDLPGVWKKIIFKEDLELTLEKYQHYLSSSHDEPFETELRFKHKSGAIRWIVCSGKIIARDKQGKPLRMMGCHVDISHQKKEELEFRLFNDHYEGVLLGSNLGSWEWDLSSGKKIFNKRWADIIGYRLEELEKITQDPWKTFLHPEDLPKTEKALADHFNGQTEYYECECRMRHKDGHWVWILDKGKVMHKDEQGNPLWMYGSHQDITQRKTNELNLLHYQMLLEKTNQVAKIGTWEMDLLSHQITWSRITKQIHEVADDYIPDLESSLNFFHGAHKANISEALEQAINSSMSYDLELQILSANNKLKWVRAVGIPEFENGRCIRLYGLFQDINEKKVTELELHNSLKRNRIFVEQCPNAIAMFDKDMCYLAASRQWIKDYHLEGQDILGKSHYDIFPEIGEDWKDIHQECMQGAINQCEEAMFVRADGSQQWISWDVRPWYLSENQVGGILMYTSEISERKKAQLQLAQSEERFRKTFDNAAIGMALVSPDGKWLSVNQSVCNFLGYSKEELLKLSFQEITHPEDLEADLTLVRKILKGQLNTYQLEKRYIHKKGEIVWGLLAVSLVRDEDGNPVHFISQIKNITERKRAASQLKESYKVIKEQNNRLMNFAHIVSHNLRSHSGNLQMILEILNNETDEKEKETLLNNIHSISTSLSETISYLTEVVQIQTNTDREREALNLHYFLQKNISTLSADLRNTGGEISLDVDPEETILFNPAYLDSVLLNFLTNALKYRHPERKPLIRIHAEKQAEFIRLSIADNGLGIDLEKNGAKLFGLYKTFHEHHDARGVGLFITKNQVEAMGGRIEVASTPQLGTTFYLYLCYKKDSTRLHHR